MKDRLQLLANWLIGFDEADADYDPYTSGDLERIIVESQIDTMNKIGDYLSEILNFTEDELTKNLNNYD